MSETHTLEMSASPRDGMAALRVFDNAASSSPRMAQLAPEIVSGSPSQRQQLLGEAAQAVCEHRSGCVKADQPTTEADAALVVLDGLRRDLRIGIATVGKTPVLHWADLGLVNAAQASRAVGHGGLKVALAALRDPGRVDDAVKAWEAEGARVRESREQSQHRQRQLADAMRPMRDVLGYKFLWDSWRDQPHATADQLAYEQALRDELRDLAAAVAVCEAAQDRAGESAARKKRSTLLTHLRSHQSLFMTSDDMARCAGVTAQALSTAPTAPPDPQIVFVIEDIQRRAREILGSGWVEMPRSIQEAWDRLADFAVEEGHDRDSLANRPPDKLPVPAA